MIKKKILQSKFAMVATVQIKNNWKNLNFDDSFVLSTVTTCIYEIHLNLFLIACIENRLFEFLNR
jgi:hypothetical protein